MSERTVNCLAFDLGSSSGRACLAQYKEGRIHLEEVDRFSTQQIRTEQGLQWDFYTLLARLKANLTSYARERELPLDSVGVECCGDDYGLLDEEGRLLGLPFNYRDGRTVGTERIIADTFGAEEVYRRTGIHFMRHNTLNQIIAEHNSGAGLLERANCMLFLGDLFHYCVTGERHVEHSGVTITQMYNTLENAWDQEICGRFGASRAVCADVIPAGQVYGRLTPQVIAETGLNDGVLAITPPTHDSASAVVPIPSVEDEDIAYVSSGTWSIIGLEIDRPIITPKSFAFNISNSGTALGKWMFTKNIMGLWILQQCRRIWERTHPGLSFADIVRLAWQAQPFAAMIDPDDSAFFDSPDIPSEIERYLVETGQKPIPADDIGGIARVICESLAMKYRFIFGHMCEASGKRPKRVYIIGGGGNNDMIDQFAANATGMPVIVSLPEATAVGNAMMQLYGLGKLGSLREIREVVQRSFPSKLYMPEDVEAWDRQYSAFLELLAARSGRSFS